MDKAALQQLFLTFEGRIARAEYWKGFLILFGIALLVMLVESAIGLAGVLSFCVSLLFAIPHIFLLIKRFHDLDKSGLFTLLIFIPLIGFFIWLIWTGCVKGTDGANRFGEDPLQ